MTKIVPSVSVSYASNGSSTKSNALGMRPMQERAYERRGEQYLLIKSPPASGKSRALMFIALDKLHNQGLKQAIIVVPEKSIGAPFNDEPLSKYGFWADWQVEPKWNLCNAPGADNGGKVKSLGAFLDSDDRILVCTHATFRFAVDQFGVAAFDDRLIAVDAQTEPYFITDGPPSSDLPVPPYRTMNLPQILAGLTDGELDKWPGDLAGTELERRRKAECESKKLKMARVTLGGFCCPALETPSHKMEK